MCDSWAARFHSKFPTHSNELWQRTLQNRLELFLSYEQTICRFINYIYAYLIKIYLSYVSLSLSPSISRTLNCWVSIRWLTMTLSCAPRAHSHISTTIWFEPLSTWADEFNLAFLAFIGIFMFGQQLQQQQQQGQSSWSAFIHTSQRQQFRYTINAIKDAQRTQHTHNIKTNCNDSLNWNATMHIALAANQIVI